MLFTFEKPDSTIWWILFIMFFLAFMNLSSLFLQVSASSATNSHSEEAKVLLEWKASLSPQSQANLSSWNSFTNHCKDWKGIACDQESMSVSNISLSSLGLEGTLHSLTFSAFPNLHVLDISNNRFYGNIPPQIGNLSSIFTLNLGINLFNGPIPKEIGALKTLSWLSLQACYLAGPIPHEIMNLKNLTDLILGTTKLSGLIPHEIGTLSNLNHLDLSENPLLYGGIPPSIGNLTKLSILYLYYSNLSGSIPSELGKLHSLTDLQLQGNSLSGRIPSSIGNLTNLTNLDLNKNQVSGPIPSSIGNLVTLEKLNLENNSLSGSIPSAIGSLINLKSLLRLGHNSLSGSIPSSIGNLVNLELLNLGYNSLSGPLPSTIGNLTNLCYLFLISNKLSGHLPLEMNRLVNLNNLHLSENDFTGQLPQVCIGGNLYRFTAYSNRFGGPIPTSLKKCTSLARLRLDDNHFVQNITEAFGVYPSLEYIDLGGNNFYGHLSSNWGKCHNLSALKIANNNLSGGIPPNLREARNLGELDLSYNHLTGEIPMGLGNLISLNRLSLSHNNLSGSIPFDIGSLNQLQRLELEANDLSGSITEGLGGLSKLLLLNLSKNRVKERISPMLGQLKYLQCLDLSGNLFQGNIPPTLGELPQLEILNLSHNNLSGEIPSTFDVGMSSLSSVDISYNQLEGSLPKNPAFHKFEALKNNKHLCGRNVTGLELCSSSENNTELDHKRKKIKLLMILLPTLGILMLLAIGVSYILHRFAKKEKNQDEEVQAQDLYFVSSFEREIIYENIIEATKNFDDMYLIGTGGQGSVYKAELSKGQVFAVKKLHSRPDGEISNMKAFKSEIQALTEIKHHNIVKLYGFCSNSQFSFLVYEFMEGGSLDNILKNEMKATKLDWSRRLNIVKDVANALFHMHHGCSYRIVHRDISSKNVLLDSEYQEARITDFGTSKFLKPDSNNMTTFAGTIGYAAPEIAYIMEANEKCDVYSFGVLTMEIIMGKHPGDLISSLAETSATYNFLLKDLLDPRLALPTESIIGKLMLIAKLAFACLSENPSCRPTMEEVSVILVKPNYHLGDNLSTITIGQLMKTEPPK